MDNPIVCLIRSIEIRGRCTHKTEIKIKSPLDFRSSLGGSKCGLLLDVSFLLPVDEPEWVVLKIMRYPSNVSWEEIELIFAWTSEALHPKFGFGHTILCNRVITLTTTGYSLHGRGGGAFN